MMRDEFYFKPHCVWFYNGYVIVTANTNVDEFVMPLGNGVGYGHFVFLGFENQSKNLKRFELKEVLPTHCPAQHLLVESLGVLWKRHAAIEAEKSISAYQADFPSQSSQRSFPG